MIMNKPLRVLVVEDSEEDLELLVLSSDGVDTTSRMSESRPLTRRNLIRFS